LPQIIGADDSIDLQSLQKVEVCNGNRYFRKADFSDLHCSDRAYCYRDESSRGYKHLLAAARRDAHLIRDAARKDGVRGPCIEQKPVCAVSIEEYRNDNQRITYKTETDARLVSIRRHERQLCDQRCNKDVRDHAA